jgi:hypothetical protein
MTTLNKEACPCCGQSINQRKITLFRGMADSLKKVFQWCIEKNKHEFSRKDIKHLLTTDSEIARFGDWVWFGGIVYKRGKGEYGINMERANAFFTGKLKIPMTIVKDPKTDEHYGEDYRSLSEMHKLKDLLDIDGSYIAEYVPSHNNKLNI